MFTINIYLRFALIGFFLIGGTALAFIYGFWYSFPLLLIGLILLVSYILLGTVQSAAKMMESMDVNSAEDRLKLTLKPEWLYPTNRAYYFLLKGSIYVQRKETQVAEEWFEKAKQIDLPSDNERALVYLQLANFAANRGNWPLAKRHFREVKDLDITEDQLKEQVKEFQKALNNLGAVKRGQMQQGYQHRGGKRRRPKMR